MADELGEPEGSDKDKSIDFWEVLQNIPPATEQVLEKQITYLLRKYAAFIIANNDVDEDLPPQPPIFIPTGLGTHPKGEDDEEGGGSEWMIYDDGASLATTRPDLFGGYAGLATFMLVQEKMVALAIERGWQNIRFWGYGADNAWMMVNKFNLSQEEPVLNIVNYAPTDHDFNRYQRILTEFVQSGMTYQPHA